MTDVTSATFWMKVRYDIDQVNYLLKYEILDRQWIYNQSCIIFLATYIYSFHI